jgi:hypothetical protein
LKGELGAALAGARKDQRRAELRKEVRELRAKGAGQDMDPQASILTQLAKRWVPEVDFSDVRMMLTLFVAVLVEFGAAFGLYLAAGPEAAGRKGWKARKRKARAGKAGVWKVVWPARRHESWAPQLVPQAQALEARAADARAPERFRLEHARSLLSSIADRE